jgi:hypothetical protein
LDDSLQWEDFWDTGPQFSLMTQSCAKRALRSLQPERVIPRFQYAAVSHLPFLYTKTPICWDICLNMNPVKSWMKPSHAPFPKYFFHMHLHLRALCRSCLRKYAWLPFVVLLGALVVLLFALRLCQPTAFLICSITICIASAFMAGYALRMNAQWPWLHDFRRSEYAEVWDALSSTPRNAEAAATGITGESALRISGTEVATRIAVATTMTKTDDVLEIGCGVGRVGWAMASLTRS